MSSLFSWANAEEITATKIGISSTVELQAATDLRPIENRGDATKVFVELWRNVCCYQAVGACLELQLPDLLGADSLTIEELSTRAACENVSALKTLCDTLVIAKILSYDNEQQFKLTDAGALLQHGLDANIGHIIDAMTSDKVKNVWANLASTIVNKTQSDEQVDDEVLTMHCDDFEANAVDELHQTFALYNPCGATIMYWGLENVTDTLSAVFPHSTITQIDSSAEISGPIDMLILHRTMAVYGLPRVIERCKSALSPNGSIIVIDTVEHPETCTNDLYAHAAMLPPRPTEEEWKEMWEGMQISSPHHIRAGVIALQLLAPMRI